MALPSDIGRSVALARLAQSRAEIRNILEPAPKEPTSKGSHNNEESSDFPRSRTMRMLTSGRGLGTVGAIVGGLLVARPRLAVRLLRMIPVRTVTRVLAVRAIAAIRAKHE